MDRAGVWRFAPAYDVTFAYNSQNIWLREHLMGIDGKFGGITTQDLYRFADNHRIPYARQVIKQIKAAVGNWPDYARKAGVSSEATTFIAEKLNPGTT